MLGAGPRRVLAGRRAADRFSNVCTGSITTPIDATVTINLNTINCSTGAIVIDSVAAGSGIVQINGAWRLT
jgi:hypothetical protein